MTQTQDDKGIEMTLLERSSMRNMQAANDSGMVLRDLFDSGANDTGSLLVQLQQPFEEPSSFYHLSNDSLAREQVDMETGEQFMCLNVGEGSFQRITETISPRASNSFSSWNLGIPLVQKEDETDLLSETSKSTSNDSDDIGIIEDNSMENIYEGETGESPPRETESPPRETVSLLSATGVSNTENEELVVPSSQDDRDEEKPLEDVLEIGDKTSEDVEDDCGQKEPMEEEDEKRAAKRPRLSSSTCELEEMEKI